MFKLVVAFCIGLGALYGAQRVFLSAVAIQVTAQSQRPAFPQAPPLPTMKVDPDQLAKAINPGLGKIDTTTGQRLAIEGAGRRVDLMNRAAASAVPLPPHIPGLPR